MDETEAVLDCERSERLLHLLDRIDAAIADKAIRINPTEFERFALDRLGRRYPTLAPVSGGSDWGRDGDLPDPDGGPPIRLLATSSRTLAGVRSNLHSGLKSMGKHERPVERVLLVNLASLSAANIASLEKSAATYGVSVLPPYGRQWVASQLREDGEWRQRLLGIPGDPVGVSRLPHELADSPWGRLPLVGREAELEALLADEARDLIVSGLPGCGKSRLLSEMDGVVFVDRDVAIDVVLDDLRMLKPKVVVVDDAFGRRRALRQIALARRQEPDLLAFRLLAVCWPDEAEELQDDMRSAECIEIELLEQASIDQILQAMGVNRLLARHEILRQAEGRPGWGVALADLLVSARDATDLLSGRALRGEVHRYLRRRNLGEAADILAAIATLGAVGEDELGNLSSELGLARSHLGAVLASAARSGLVDVTRSWSGDGIIRSYVVRPPMLAYALVAERAFEAEVPAFNLLGLFERWPDHRRAIASAAIEVARLDVEGARLLAERLYDLVMVGEASRSDRGTDLARSFGHLDRAAAQHVLDRLAEPFQEVVVSDRSNIGYALSPYVGIAAALAPWKLPQAVRLLLDAAVVDRRETGVTSNHPLPLISGLITKFHPEVPADRGLPRFVIESANAWLGDDPDEAHWFAWAHAAGAAINPRRSAAFTDPGHPMSVSLYETVAGPDESIEVSEQVWPLVIGRLVHAPSQAFSPVLQSVESWLRVGAGFDQPFGNDHPPELVENASQIGQGLLRDLISCATGRPGVMARLRGVAERCHAELDVPVPSLIDGFLVEPGSGREWRRDHSRTVERVREAVAGWHEEEGRTVVERLVDVRSELELAGHRWPSTVRMSCEEIGSKVDDLLPWLVAALDLGLFPEAEPFVGLYRRRHRSLPKSFIERGMADARARWAIARTVLSDGSAQAEEVRLVLGHLGPSDVALLAELNTVEGLMDRVRQILVEAAPVVRAAMAVAMAEELTLHETWSPGNLEGEWLRALDAVALVASAVEVDNDLFRMMATLYPSRLIELVRAALPASEEELWLGGRPPQAMIDALADLPAADKVALLSAEPAGRPGRRCVLDGIFGREVDWIPGALDGGYLTAEEVVDHVGRFGPRPPIEDLARILVPRGADPDRLVHLAGNGVWSGERSNWHQSNADMFAQMALSDEGAVAEVGRRGQTYFQRQADAARREEKRERILGYR